MNHQETINRLDRLGKLSNNAIDFSKIVVYVNHGHIHHRDCPQFNRYTGGYEPFENFLSSSSQYFSTCCQDLDEIEAHYPGNASFKISELANELELIFETPALRKAPSKVSFKESMMILEKLGLPGAVSIPAENYRAAGIKVQGDEPKNALVNTFMEHIAKRKKKDFYAYLAENYTDESAPFRAISKDLMLRAKRVGKSEELTEALNVLNSALEGLKAAEKQPGKFILFDTYRSLPNYTDFNERRYRIHQILGRIIRDEQSGMKLWQAPQSIHCFLKEDDFYQWPSIILENELRPEELRFLNTIVNNNRSIHNGAKGLKEAYRSLLALE